jgi:hypothetical protein
MAFLDETFEADSLPVGNTSYGAIPAGWYNATIQKAELKNTKAGNGRMISLRLAITGPTHQGRVVFCNLNINNPNPQAEEIGRQQLGEIMRAIGLARVGDTDELVGGMLSVKLVLKNDGEENDVKGFKAVGGSIPKAMPSSMPAPAASQSAPAKAAPPWAKK